MNMNLDLMIDCMPYNDFDDKLYEMLEDDMKIISNLNCPSSSSSSSSPSCLSDEEQLALTSCTNFDDFLLFSAPQADPVQTVAQPVQQQTGIYANNSMHHEPISTQALDDAYNSIMNLNSSFSSSQYSFQSSCSSSATSSSAPSPLSLSSSSSSLCAALASASFQSSTRTTPASSTCSSSLSSPICLSPNQFNNNQNLLNQAYPLDDFSTNSSISNNNSSQPNLTNQNYNLYQVINPMDINRNYSNTSDSISQSHLQTKTISLNSNSLQLVTGARPAQISINKTTGGYVSSPQIKRGKFSHNTSATIIKQEPMAINSDGESTISNESDSNSNFSNSSVTSTPNNSNNTNFSINSNEYPSKKVIITTKLEPFYNIPNNTTQNTNTNQSSGIQLLNVNNTQTINVIKITNPKENLLESAKTTTTTTTTGGLQLPISTNAKSPTTDNANHKTIIQYKQLINSPTNLTTTSNSTPNTTTTTTTTSTTNVKQASIKNRQNPTTLGNSNVNTSQTGVVTQVALRSDGKAYPKPPYSYSCLIAMALRNSDSGTLPVSDIYEFIIENFPYYKTARDGWKNSIRHNLSLNKCFEKIENPTNGSKKGCLWALNPDKCKKLEEECKRCRQRDPVNIRLSMSRPDDLNKIERGEQRIKKYTAQRKLIENGTMNISNQNTQIQQSNEKNNFLLEWTNKSILTNSNVNIKEEETENYFEEFGNADIKFDPNLLTTVNTVIRTNIQ